jgi:hypothetical protein
MICECDAPVSSHLGMSHTVMRKPRMHGSPQGSPGVTEILESKVFTLSSPCLSHIIVWASNHKESFKRKEKMAR